MWKPYLNVIADRAGHALNILDRYHVMATMNKKVDKVRAEETRQMKQDGYEPILKHSRWCLLKRPENLTDKQTVKLSELLEYNLRSMRAYLLPEDFQRFWEYMNNKVKFTTRKSYGFRTYEAIEIAPYHNLGRLPEPEFTHRFW